MVEPVLPLPKIAKATGVPVKKLQFHARCRSFRCYFPNRFIDRDGVEHMGHARTKLSHVVAWLERASTPSAYEEFAKKIRDGADL